MKLTQRPGLAPFFVSALLFSATVAHAAPTPATSTPVVLGMDDNHNAFALGYVLEYSHLQAFRFIDDVKLLRDINDDGKAGAMVQDLNVRGEQLRKLEADTLRRAANCLDKLHGPQTSIDWATKTADSLGKPADKAPQGIISDELAVEKLTAIIDETGRVQKELLDNVAEIDPVLGARSLEALWAFNAGTYDAKLHLWNGDPADMPQLRKEANHLVANEPPSVPVGIGSALKVVAGTETGLPSLQKGTGNLSTLLPSHGDAGAGPTVNFLANALTANYDASALVRELDGEHKLDATAGK